MGYKIRIMIVDDTPETRKNLRKLLELEEDMEVVGEAGNGEEALVTAARIKPDVILMDINMPLMDGITATEKMTLEYPQIAIIILSVQGEQEYLRKAMAAGAREYLTKPPSSEELILTVRRVFELELRRHLIQNVASSSEDQRKEPGKAISVFCTKGGVGKSTIAVNLAVAIKQSVQAKVALVDLDLQFGDIAMLLDLIPRRTISDLVGEPDQLNIKTLESYLIPHSTGVDVLPAPLRPEYAELVQSKHVEGIINLLKQHFDYIIIDTSKVFDDLTLTVLDISDYILVITTLDVLTIKNVKLALEAMSSLNYETSKIKMILNRSTAEIGISPNDLESSLRYPITSSIPSDGKVVVGACNRGIPFVISDPKSSLTEAFLGLARELTGVKPEKKDKTPSIGWRNIIRR